MSGPPHLDEGPGEHDAQFMDDNLEETVACARCGKSIWAYTQRCPECGVHFDGEAWEFKPAGQASGFGRGRVFRWLAALVLVLLLISWLLW